MPITSSRDKVRLLIGDTDADDAQLSDDEIDYFVTYRTDTSDDAGDYVNIPAAAADAAGAIAAKFARGFNFAEDGQRFDVAQRYAHYINLERELRNRSGGVAVPLGGTLSV